MKHNEAKTKEIKHINSHLWIYIRINSSKYILKLIRLNLCGEQNLV